MLAIQLGNERDDTGAGNKVLEEAPASQQLPQISKFA